MLRNKKVGIFIVTGISLFLGLTIIYYFVSSNDTYSTDKKMPAVKQYSASINSFLTANESKAIEIPPPEIFERMCVACHSLDGSDGGFGPSLKGVGSRYDKAYLVSWITDPQKMKPGATMPKMALGEHEINQLADFLASNK